MRNAIRIILTYVLPILLVVLTTKFLLGGLGGVDQTTLLNDMLNVHPMLIFLAGVTGILAHVSRAVRWQVLLQPNGIPVPFGTSFSAVMIGYAANALVPRSGEVARPLVLSQRTGLAAETAIGSVVVERVLDVLSLLGALLLVMTYGQHELTSTMMRLQGTSPSTFAAADAESTILRLLTLLGLLTAVVALVLFTRWGELLIEQTLGRVHAKSSIALLRVVQRLRSGLDAVRKPKLIAQISLHTVLIWILYTVTTWLAVIAMPYPATSSPGLSSALLLLVILALAVTIAPTPGAIGVYHIAGQVGLVSLFGATPYEGFVFAMVSWIINQGTALAVGGIAWVLVMRSGVRVQLFSQPSQQEISTL